MPGVGPRPPESHTGKWRSAHPSSPTSRLRSGDFVIGEYGSRIYQVNAVTGEKTLLLTNPVGTRHFHFTAVDPFTNDIYTSLGDALKRYAGFGLTGIMRSRDFGKQWDWLYKTTVGSGAIDRQPTAIFSTEIESILERTASHMASSF